SCSRAPPSWLRAASVAARAAPGSGPGPEPKRATHDREAAIAALLRERRGPQDEAVAILCEAVLEMESPTGDQHAVPVRAARADRELARSTARAPDQVLEHALDLHAVGGVAMERGLARDRERDLAFVHRRGVAPAAALVEQPAVRAEQRLQHRGRERAQVAD